MSYKKYYSELVVKLIDEKRAGRRNLIFVHFGQSSLLDGSEACRFIVDEKRFGVEGDESVFDKIWFKEIFLALQEDKEYHLLSLAQFSYLLEYAQSSLFDGSVVILKDNLRQLFPIKKEDYLEQNENEDIEARPERLPVYQAEQMVINGKYYYSAKLPFEAFEMYDIFTELKGLVDIDDRSLKSIDLNAGLYSLEEFINECVEVDDFGQRVSVRFNEKQLQSPVLIEVLKKVNALLSDFGGIISVQKEDPVSTNDEASEKVKKLLSRYWGEHAGFRNISIYKNPNITNEVVALSQGIIVETIIKEYEKSIRGEPSRDLFLTAPTGSGKSLLFQLPAFYIAGEKHVTIVVSPLIALMKDQVDAIKLDRGFDGVAYINSELNLIERERVIESCKRGDIDILYMAPELLLSYDISHFVGGRRLGLLVIDEAHLITTWGRDFRVDYWFLGNHIRKMRKYHKLDFPMVAVTATAIYGGANDMVFDSIDSLAMHNPHVFIGDVKRENIEFIVNTYDKFSRNYDSNKIAQTVDFIKRVDRIGLKTLVYAPYTKHVTKILSEVNSELPNVATGYHGSLEPIEKEYAYRLFKSNNRRVMISTKAFGMGVDLPDIQVVYHHAPSGLLPDYVQEIGRVARNPDMEGYAALNYSSQDQRYTRALHGMSALRHYQIKEVLKKIYNTYLLNNKCRNLLLSVDDFGYIFDNPSNLDQKLLTALMMIEKDYLAKNRFNVIIARPKKLFVKVYARVAAEDLARLAHNYSGSYETLYKIGDSSVIQLDLDKLWRERFSQDSFPKIKRKFYDGGLLRDQQIRLIPQLKMSYSLSQEYINVLDSLTDAFRKIEIALSSTNAFFSKDGFKKLLDGVLGDSEKAEKLARFILTSYSGVQTQPGAIEVDAFLQYRKKLDGIIEYRVFGARYLACFNALIKLLNDLFHGASVLRVDRFVTNHHVSTVDYIRLGFFIEILELGSFEVVGGENPMVFIRVNDPDRVKRDSTGSQYRNNLLVKTLERHDLSNLIYDHFFLRKFTNDERWGLIEDYFLGLDLDSIFAKYPGLESSKIDIIEILKERCSTLPGRVAVDDGGIDVNVFLPVPGRYYTINNPLTIIGVDGPSTKNISEWIDNDPVSLDKSKRLTPFFLEAEAFKILFSKLQAYHQDYLKGVLGLKSMIEFKGFDRLVRAVVPYRTRPVQFYQWWCSEPEAVFMSDEEMSHLFRKVYQLKPSALKRDHRRIIGKD